MTSYAESVTIPVTPRTYTEILQFYAEHAQLLDNGLAEAWADQFTPDGVFSQNVKPVPKIGRAEIGTGMRRGIDRIAATGATRRHWFGMVVAEAQPDDSVRTRYYALVIETPKNGRPSIYLSTTGEDVLVRHDRTWLVRSRHVAHDGHDDIG
ncbi:hydroxylacyl-CoA dehydrogenase [Actinosynnema sp. ALI-1.44]|uniref:nuclear transport factor 2 family protein n=1 Tax=Actinosynnema sp. ALI-1.44 TaxID=1933779 RepID=UPI00097C843A|nr:nuclear transport factor 2 family protein [Actinosynnema sp. ALI-1.44]ONI76387.1 hydroxylacyl-CoA dehydrogenase [Actinosynnema sp. ALI-1.44]